jgi:hypothetical protein
MRSDRPAAVQARKFAEPGMTNFVIGDMDKVFGGRS